MSKVDWSLAPVDATHANTKASDAGFVFYRVNGHEIFRWNDELKWVESVFLRPVTHWVERPKPATWSGPQDGLPPIGVEFEWRYGDMEWKKGEALYIGKIYAILKSIDGGEQHYYLSEMNFRAIPAPHQIRETAIREFMDIVGIDCRVTASKAVDAGFKREACKSDCSTNNRGVPELLGPCDCR